MNTSHAQHLNQSCPCESAGAVTLASFLANAPVFVSAAHMREMEGLVAAIHRVVALPAFQDAALADAPPIARAPQRTAGVFAGFDFHLGAEGPRLIEINTNAGGAMLNAAAEWQHPLCCDDRDPAARPRASREALESRFVATFRNEWRRARGEEALKTIAIVDDQPTRQFLFPEFQLFAQMLAAQGFEALIADAADLQYVGGRLRTGDRPIDLVYNRLTDFYFTEGAHSALHAAYLDDAAVITPHPRAHALYADKRNLVRFTDGAFLRGVGADERDIELLHARIPLTVNVQGDPDAWWQDRKAWFFKPASGFASRGAYRGDKITRRVFGEIARGGYVAQRFAEPGFRLRQVSGDARHYKVDLRCYVYESAVQLVVARLYQGQTTNFRTAGGGFAPVIELADV